MTNLIDISDTSYRITIVLDPPENDIQTSEPPKLILQVSYPTDYPDVAPDLVLSAPPNAPKHPRIDIQEDRERLLDSLKPTIEENMGMAMVFTLVSALKDGAELLMSERANAIQAEKEIQAVKAEEEENRRFQGTAVTKETFVQWIEGFKKEMEEAEQRKLREEKEAEDRKLKKPASSIARDEKKLTGKQLWERGFAGKGDYDEGDYDNDDDAAAPAVEKLKIAS